jgi:3-phenylpropionate/trans-cinnamate dioxygenase ferredoxin component
MDRRHRRGRDRRVTATRLVDLMGVDEVPEGTMKMAHVDGSDQVIVVHTGGEIRAFQGICTHEYFELDKGFLTGGGSSGPNGKPAGTLTCALHLSRFDLANGEPLDPPAELPLAQYPVVVQDGRVLIEIPEGQLPVNE